MDNLDVSCDVQRKYPSFLCRCCVMKLDHDQKSRNRITSKIKFPGKKGNCHVFSSRESYVAREGARPICSFLLRKSPRKRGNIPDIILIGHSSESSPGASPSSKKRSEHVRQILSDSSPSSSVDSGSSKKQFHEEIPTMLNNPFEGDTYELTGI